MKSKSIISKRSRFGVGWNISPKLEAVLKIHEEQNRKIRESRKPIIKPDLDLIMENALKK